MGLFSSDLPLHSPLSSLPSRGRETIKYKLQEQAVEAEPHPFLTQLKEATSLQRITLHQSFGLNTYAHFRETTLEFCQFIPIGKFVPEKNIVNGKTHLVSSYFQYLKTVCDSSGAFWCLGKKIHPPPHFSSVLIWTCGIPHSVNFLHQFT